MNLCLVVHKYGVPLGDPCCYPLGFMYVSAGLKRLGHSVKVLNFNLRGYDLETEIAGQDAVLFTGGQEFLPAIERDAAVCRRRGVKTILGGALATFRAEKMASIIDTVVVGEADDVLSDVLSSTGIIWGRKPDVATAPWPDYEGFGVSEYLRRLPMRHMGILTARGCPFSCSFCVQTCRFQYRPLEDVFAEIDHYRNRYNPGMLVVNDNTLNIRSDRFLAFCEGMASRNLAWSAAIRTDRMDEEMVVAAKKSGASYFVVGVESFIQGRLDRMGKRTTVEDNIRTLELLHKHEMPYHGNILLGFDWDDGYELERETPLMSKYRVFPVLLYPFVGIRAKVGVFGEERQRQMALYAACAKAGGMTTYPEANEC